MLVELELVEERLKAGHEVLDGATVTDVAKRNGAARWSVRTRLRPYTDSGIAGLVDGTSPTSCGAHPSPCRRPHRPSSRRCQPAP